MERTATSEILPVGGMMPQFSLPSTDGTVVGNAYFDGAAAALVVFTCNHCPYVKGSDAALDAVVARFREGGLKTVGISSNDASAYPADSFEAMKEKAASRKEKFPYLYDETQEVAKRFDAACTPECFLFDRSGRLVFHGTVNDSPRDPAAAKEPYLEKAVEAVIAGRRPEPAFVHPIGCSIKWKNVGSYSG